MEWKKAMEEVLKQRAEILSGLREELKKVESDYEMMEGVWEAEKATMQAEVEFLRKLVKGRRRGKVQPPQLPTVKDVADIVVVSSQATDDATEVSRTPVTDDDLTQIEASRRDALPPTVPVEGTCLVLSSQEEECHSRPSGAPEVKYHETSRKKDVRAQHVAITCPTCASFLDALDAPQDVKDRHLQQHGRHRCKCAPSNTPPGFWDLGFLCPPEHAS
eukprot:TRINITY_DN3010_c0_g1_i1.p1 TRINITY_DN3010_c0_g1~~TRINITY_DN3010_c0_g1_i1.p1  ORF type:complete len:232 (+),score=88.22 TRINITY_DN3010_c0_g1_i1:45-698(+)